MGVERRPITSGGFDERGFCSFGPGIVLDKQRHLADRKPAALIGKVYCKVDADCGAVAVGDLLTTAAMPGHAVNAADPQRGFQAVIDKALAPLSSGRGLIPILVALHSNRGGALIAAAAGRLSQLRRLWQHAPVRATCLFGGARWPHVGFLSARRRLAHGALLRGTIHAGR
jgi:hypothetical protein